MAEKRKVILAYSGSVASSVILKWLLSNHEFDVITVTVDLGQPEDLLRLEEKAIALGASRAFVLDLREEFARDYVFPMMRAAARYEGRYLLGTAIARPCIAHALVEVARSENADAIAHGAICKGNDQVRFEFAVKALAPDIRVITPDPGRELLGREALRRFAAENGICETMGDSPYSIDANILHTSYEGCELEDPGVPPDASCNSRVVPPEEAPDKPEIVEVGFVRGNPVSVNGQQLPPYELLARLGEIAGGNGIGREDMVENRYVGMKCRGVYENPAGTLLFALHRDLEGICLDREMLAIRDMLAVPYSNAVYNGYWYSPEREAMQAFFDKSQETVTGRVKAKLYKGNICPLARTSPYSLYSRELANFSGSECDLQDATGFIRVNGLRLGLYAGIRSRMGR